MKNRVPEVFLSEMFGELRIMEDDNKFYFCAADVCSALGYSNPSHELNIHCRHDGIKAGRTDVNGVPRIIKFISEGNVYRLICRSNKPEAEKFETWVFDELLPRIRQTGGYVNDPVVFVDNWLHLNTITTFTLYLNRMQRCRKQNTGGALMFKVLGGIGRSVPLYNGKARILVKAIIPAAPKCLAEMQSICEANGWKSVLDERGNLVVLSVVSIDAYRLSDSTLMTAYLHFAETAAQKLTGNKNRYLVAGVVSYDAAA